MKTATKISLPARRKQFIPDDIVQLYYSLKEVAEKMCARQHEVAKMVKISNIEIKRSGQSYRFTKQDIETIEFCFYLKRDIGLSYNRISNYLKNTSVRARDRKSFNQDVQYRTASTLELKCK